MVKKKFHPTEQEYMGVSEIAAYRGVTKAAVSQWVKVDNGKLPRPWARLRMGPVWRTIDIKRWFE